MGQSLPRTEIGHEKQISDGVFDAAGLKGTRDHILNHMNDLHLAMTEATGSGKYRYVRADASRPVLPVPVLGAECAQLGWSVPSLIFWCWQHSQLAVRPKSQVDCLEHDRGN